MGRVGSSRSGEEARDKAGTWRYASTQTTSPLAACVSLPLGSATASSPAAQTLHLIQRRLIQPACYQSYCVNLIFLNLTVDPNGMKLVC